MKTILSLISLIFLTSCAIGAGENSKMLIKKECGLPQLIESDLEKNARQAFPKPSCFPQLVGIDLEGEKRQLPQSFDNKINIVVVAFKREQQENVNGWIKVVDEIIKKRSDINFYELPVIYELNPVSRSFINNGMRRGVLGEKARKRTITVYTDRQKFFETMNMKEDKIYLLLIDKDGKIWQRIEGDATSLNINRLEDLMGLTDVKKHKSIF